MNEILIEAAKILKEANGIDAENEWYEKLKLEMKKPGADSKTLGFCLMAFDSKRLCNDIKKIQENRNKALRLLFKMIGKFSQ